MTFRTDPLPDRILLAEAQAQVDHLQGLVDAALTLHRKSRLGTWCGNCGETSPCRTARALGVES